MPGLPTGTVTFLFSDIEGSTRMLAELGTDYMAVLDRHRALLRRLITAHGGVERATEGDSFFVVFDDASAALAMAVEGQRALAAEPWPAGGDVRVRMGLLTGEGTPSDDGYVGLAVHRAARIAAAAHGGQLLIADSTRTLVERTLPAGVELRDLGMHQLRDLPAPERIYQVVIDGLSSEFPPPRTLERPSNLPSSLSSFVGREHENAQLCERLATARLVTLTGPGGTGKTRLAVRVAAQLVDRFEHGAWFVPLEALSDPELVPGAIATALGARVGADRGPIEALEAWLAHREALLVLDNFEHVVTAAPFVVRLLAAAPRLRVLVTSRMPLHVYGETEYALSPLPVKDEAVRLFVDRATSANPAFALSEANASAVSSICAGLDGLPLAIELAAARAKLLSAEQIAARLDDSLALLASPARDVPERQRTLHAAIAWSVRLLSADEQRLLARLSVFRGGIALDAAEAVAGDALALDMLNALASLVDQSLLRPISLPSETRFVMLETIRQYTAELLMADAYECATTVRRHAAHFFALARASEPELTGVNQVAWLNQLEREMDNLRAAYAAAEQSGLVDEALVAAGAMWRFWQQRGHFSEARSVFDRLLAIPAASPGARAKALGGAGGIAYWQGDIEQMTRCYTEASALYELTADRRGLARALLDEAYVPFMRGEWAAGRTLSARARDIFEELDDEVGVADAETNLGVGDYFEHDFPTKIEHWENAVDIYRRHARLLELADVLNNLAFARALLGHWPQALTNIREALSIFEAAGNEVGVAMVLEGFAAIAEWIGDAARAARLFGYADATKERLRGGPPPSMLRTGGYRLRAAEALGPDEFQRLHAEGGKLPRGEAMALADVDVPADTPPFPGVGGLPREQHGAP